MLTVEKVNEIVKQISAQIDDSDAFVLIMQTPTSKTRYEEFEMATENFIRCPDLQHIAKREFN